MIYTDDKMRELNKRIECVTEALKDVIRVCEIYNNEIKELKQRLDVEGWGCK